MSLPQLLTRALFAILLPQVPLFCLKAPLNERFFLVYLFTKKTPQPYFIVSLNDPQAAISAASEQEGFVHCLCGVAFWLNVPAESHRQWRGQSAFFDLQVGIPIKHYSPQTLSYSWKELCPSHSG